MLLITPSIMHSGTHLLKQNILKDFKYWPYDERLDGDFQAGVHYVTHVNERQEDWMSRGDHIVSPMRHPARILASFQSRNRPITMEDTKERIKHLEPHMFSMGMKEGADYESQWKNLAYFMDRYDINFIHIDADDRDEQVEKFGKKIGRDLHCDWPVDNNSGARCGNHDKPIEECPQPPEWVMEIYRGTC